MMIRVLFQLFVASDVVTTLWYGWMVGVVYNDENKSELKLTKSILI